MKPDPARRNATPKSSRWRTHFRSQRAPACGHQGPDHGADLDPALASQLRALGYVD